MPTSSCDEKLRELVLYISELSEGDRPFGAVKLNKLLFYVDFNAYKHLGKPVTGQEYQKLEHGPCPRRMKPIMESMSSSGEIAIRKVEYYGHNQHRPFALREPNLDIFTAREIDLINRVVEHFRGINATEISEKSHAFAGWLLAEEGETIPYDVALVGNQPPSTKALKKCKLSAHLAEECLSE